MEVANLIERLLETEKWQTWEDLTGLIAEAAIALLEMQKERDEEASLLRNVKALGVSWRERAEAAEARVKELEAKLEQEEAWNTKREAIIVNYCSRLAKAGMERDEARAALEPFVSYYNGFALFDIPDDFHISDQDDAHVCTVEDLRRARAALGDKP